MTIDYVLNSKYAIVSNIHVHCTDSNIQGTMLQCITGQDLCLFAMMLFSHVSSIDVASSTVGQVVYTYPL